MIKCPACSRESESVDYCTHCMATFTITATPAKKYVVVHGLFSQKRTNVVGSFSTLEEAIENVTNGSSYRIYLYSLTNPLEGIIINKVVFMRVKS